MGASTNPVRVTYITGISYCGSTLLSIVFNAHPDVVSVGEMGPARSTPHPDYECSCGTRIVECDFFKPVAERMREQGVPFDPARMRLRHTQGVGGLQRLWYRTIGIPPVDRVRDAVREFIPSVRRHLDEYARRNEAFMRAALRVSGKRVFLDATKHADRIPLLRRMNADLRVIHLIRDPRGFLYSARKYNEISAEEAAREFVRGHEEIEYHLGNLPRRHRMQINYETICEDPQYWFCEMSKFMAVDCIDLPADYRAQDYHVIGNRMRKRGDVRTTIRLDEKWRGTLSQADLDTVARIAGPLARRYGYEIQPGKDSSPGPPRGGRRRD